jgi:hypothetical protein
LKTAEKPPASPQDCPLRLAACRFAIRETFA